MRAIKNILLIMTLTVMTSCASRRVIVTQVEPIKKSRIKTVYKEPIKKSRMQRLIECTKGLLEQDVNPVEASKICEGFLNSRRK